ncbi:MAG: hypothetical protein ABGY24_02455, partial [bacterium]
MVGAVGTDWWSSSKRTEQTSLLDPLTATFFGVMSLPLNQNASKLWWIERIDTVPSLTDLYQMLRKNAAIGAQTG